jgi:SAM-dependent methyltransferase
MANEAAAQRWNGESGTRWVENRERLVAIRERVTPHLFRAAAIAPGERVLDVGCGCGETTVAAGRAAGPGGGALGLDLSGPMLAVARRLAAEAGLANVDFVQGDAQVYPLPPADRDVVISAFGIMFFDDPAAAFGNLRAGLRPGGRLAFQCWQADARNELFGIPLRAFNVHTGQPDLEEGGFADPGWITELPTGAGFTDINVEPIREPARLGSDVPDVMGYTLGMTRIRELFSGLGDDPRAARVRSTMAEAFTAHQRPDGVWVEAAAWLVTARVP